MTPEQSATIEHWQAFNVPGVWHYSAPSEVGTVSAVFVGDLAENGGSYVWIFAISPDGQYSSSEHDLGEEREVTV